MTRAHRTLRVRFFAPLLTATILLFAAGCAGALPPIELGGRPYDIAALVGQWSGEYAGGGGVDRRGSITFALKEDEGFARGGVEMIPRGLRRIGPNRLPDNLPVESQRDQFLMITFVRVDERAVSGTLDVYWDPDRNSWVKTVFFGELRGDVIQGSFRTTSEMWVAPTYGTWRVKRMKTVPDWR